MSYIETVAYLWRHKTNDDTPRHTVEHIAECCVELCINPADAFLRLEGTGNLARAPKDVLDRHAIFYLAKCWHHSTGPLSYPEIAHASGLDGHSTVVEGVQLFAALMRNAATAAEQEAVKAMRETIRDLRKCGEKVEEL